MPADPEISSIDDIVFYAENFEQRVEMLSDFAEKKVSHTLFLIDDAVSSWEAAGKKPEYLRRDIVLLSEFREHFGEWQKHLLLSKNESTEKKARILDEFADLCDEYEKSFTRGG